MKLTIKIILILLFIPLFLVSLFAVTLKYQLLKPNFWQTAFESGNVYPALAEKLKMEIENQTVRGGGNKKEAKVLSDIITPENLKDFFVRNSNNFLNYANGGTKEIKFYIPISAIPEGLLPTEIGQIAEEMPFADFLAMFGYRGLPVEQLALLGPLATSVWIASLVLVSIIVVLLYKLTGAGKRFFSLGVAFLLSGIIILILVAAGTAVRINMAADLVGRPYIADALLGIIAPPLIEGILEVWKWVGIGLVILGAGVSLI